MFHPRMKVAVIPHLLILTFHCCESFKHLFYGRERKREREGKGEGKRKRSSVHYSSPQMSTTGKFVPGQSQEPETPPGSPTPVARTQPFGMSSAASPEEFTGTWM